MLLSCRISSMQIVGVVILISLVMHNCYCVSGTAMVAKTNSAATECPVSSSRAVIVYNMAHIQTGEAVDVMCSGRRMHWLVILCLSMQDVMFAYIDFVLFGSVMVTYCVQSLGVQWSWTDAAR